MESAPERVRFFVPSACAKKASRRCAKGTFQIAHRKRLCALEGFCYVQFGTSLLHIRTTMRLAQGRYARSALKPVSGNSGAEHRDMTEAAGEDHGIRTLTHGYQPCAKGTFQIAHRKRRCALKDSSYVQFGTSLLHMLRGGGRGALGRLFGGSRIRISSGRGDRCRCRRRCWC